MQSRISWLAIPTAIAIAISSASAVHSQIVAVTPGSQKIELNGTSGGSKKESSCAGYVAAAPNHTIQVVEDMGLTFTLKAAGEPALLIRGDNGKEFCVPADSFSNGEIKVPGRWKKGTYKIFVGDRANGKFPYALAVSKN
jgi:hypothetical protein